MRLQEMMGVMARERGGSVFATDERCGAAGPGPVIAPRDRKLT